VVNPLSSGENNPVKGLPAGSILRPAGRPLTPAATALALTTAFLWGGTAVSNQFAVDQLPPLLVGGLRFFMAGLFMLPWCLIEGAPVRITREQWRPVIIMSILLFLQIGSFNIGCKWSTSSHASLFVNTYIFWVAGIEHFVMRTIRLRAKAIVGLAIAGAGVAALLMSTAAPAAASARGLDQPTVIGDVILLVSGFILAAKVLYTKEAVRTIAPATVIMWHDFLGAGLFFAASALTEPLPTVLPTLPAIWALLYGGFIVSGFCFGAHAWQLRTYGASQISVFSFTTPVFGVGLGVLLRGDALSPWLLVGGVAVAVGITLVNLPEGSEAEAPE
jgi:drug/metabolite transporter (DMT)-like permease